MKKVLLTGGAGFVGSHLVARLVDDHEVVVLDSLRRDALSGSAAAGHPNLHCVVGDVRDAALVHELAEGCSAIVHMASIAGVDTVLEFPVETMRINMLGTMNVLDAALATASTLEHVIDFSTSEVFGQHAYRVEETHGTHQGAVGEARWSYAVSKLAGEYLAHGYVEQYGLPATTVRPFNIYGPGQIGGGAIHAFIVAALEGRDLTVHNDGAQIRAWCYVDDMVEAVLAMLACKWSLGQVFNIGNARSVVTTFDLAERIIRLTGSDSQIVFKPVVYTDVDLRIPNIDKARKLLGWEPTVNLEEGLARTIAWYAAARDRPPQHVSS